MTSRYILAIDAGTTNVLAMILDESGSVRAAESKGFQLSYPSPGLVEFDPEHFWQTTLDAINAALDTAGIKGSNLAGIGITGQRSTAVVWERDSGKAPCPAVVWQDLRGSQRAKELLDKGFPWIMTFFAAVKLEQILGNLPNGFERANNKELAWGNVDAFLAWKLSNGTVYATDPSNASGVGFFEFEANWGWSDALLKTQNLSPSFFPDVVDSIGVMGYTDASVLGAEIPICAILGDQQSALYGQGCVDPGMVKVSYGTSAICNMNTGANVIRSPGSYPFPAWTRNGERTFLIEGIVITAGAVFGWLKQLGILDDIAKAEAMGLSAGDTKGVSFLPSLQGLGSPHLDYDRFGAFEGLTLGASREHIVRAAIEGVAFRVREVVDQMYLGTGLPRPDTLRVDGGASGNDLLMQIQANVLGCAIERMTPSDATAFGTALLAGEACGIWEPNSSRNLHRVDKTWIPQWSESERDERFNSWKSAFGL